MCDRQDKPVSLMGFLLALDDPAVSQTLFPRLARKYDFKIRVLHISKYFLMSGLLVEKFLLALLKALFLFF